MRLYTNTLAIITAGTTALLFLQTSTTVTSFTIISTPPSITQPNAATHAFLKTSTRLFHAPSATTTASSSSFIDTELRGQAMKLHTRAQAPKEGKAEEAPKPQEPYITTHMDYLKFLVDNQLVFQTFEDIVNREVLQPELKPFVNTGLERSQRLEQDIQFMVEEYNLERPEVGQSGIKYAQLILDIVEEKGKDGIPTFMCHYYNHYFAHTAGGRMIGKKMASLLLEKKTLEFYKWDGDLNQIKATVKTSIEEMAASWSREEKDQCVNATAAAFMCGGSLNSYLSGGRGGHH
mmetsp:Transcript_16343/g.19970  ORF Transcript_16343/g.19970 Transcript_16343/m.19970 type:complete len:291 (+) Transcript_16343:161-1033(+)